MADDLIFIFRSYNECYIEMMMAHKKFNKEKLHMWRYGSSSVCKYKSEIPWNGH